MDWRRWTHSNAAEARRKILWAKKRRALASMITLHDLLAPESEIEALKVRTVAIDASRLHWEHWVDTASREGMVH